MNNSMMNNDFMMKNQLIGFGYESNRKDHVWWLTIYTSATEDFDNIMHFINEYYEESEAPLS